MSTRVKGNDVYVDVCMSLYIKLTPKGLARAGPAPLSLLSLACLHIFEWIVVVKCDDK